MRKGVWKVTACALAAGMTFSGMSTVALADIALEGFGTEAVAKFEAVAEDTAAEPGEENAELDVIPEAAALAETEAVETEAPETEPETEPVVDMSMSGEMAFAQCDEYINIRSSADIDSEPVGKVYNNNSVTILSQVGDWYEIQSGNATGYVKAEYFATGQAAQEIAEEVAYNVATVYADALIVRAEPSEEAAEIGTVYSADELEVVEYDGDWMKVALGGDVYGYVNAYYVGYDTYYATGETLEEEQERLDQEWLDYLAQQEAEQAAAEQAYLDAIAAEEAAAQQAVWDAQYQAQAAADAAAQAATDAQAAADAQYQEYLNAQAAADAATQQADEQAVIDAAAQAEAAYQEFLNAQAAADAQAQAEADAQYQAQAAADAAAQAAADTAASEADIAAQAAAEAAQAAAQATEADYSTSSSVGQQIVDYATQFVGNPYVWGGSSLTNGADCSGFTMSVMANFGIGLPHNAAAQSGCGTPVDLSEIQPGDLLFYNGGGGIGHVSIYMGGGQVVHASSSTTGIIISDIGYRTPVCARRFV